MPDIEVTPAMRMAGALCFLDGDPRVEDIEDILERVFKAMLAARSSEARSSGHQQDSALTPQGT
jgi:hypothetical protein